MSGEGPDSTPQERGRSISPESAADARTEHCCPERNLATVSLEGGDKLGHCLDEGARLRGAFAPRWKENRQGQRRCGKFLEHFDKPPLGNRDCHQVAVRLDHSKTGERCLKKAVGIVAGEIALNHKSSDLPAARLEEPRL